MPQMMPINWMLYFILFILIFILFNIMNYYIVNMKLNTMNLSKTPKLMNFYWKW